MHAGRYDVSSAMATVSPIRVMALMEARWVTGPAKNLIAFAAQLGRLGPGCSRRVELSVATFQRPSAPADLFLAALKAAGVRAHVIPERCAGDPRIVSRLRATVEAVRPDIIQTHNSKSHLLLRLTDLSRHARWIAFHHGFTDVNVKDRVHNYIACWALKGAPSIVTVCEAFRGDLSRLGIPPSRIFVRHNMVAPFEPPGRDEVMALRDRLRIPPGARVVLAVGRLSAEKGHIDLVEAIGLLAADWRGDPFRVVIVGDGPERANLERRSKELKLSECLIFAGQQANARPFYGMADIFVLPSLSEGSPNALLEAMAAGLPIACTAVGGAAELVRDGQTALVVEPREPRALSQALYRLLTGAELARSLAEAAQTASRAYSPEAYTGSILEVYDAAMRIPLARG
jgi:glycosyltransferase involved in cell wall biosynthesis